MTLPLSTRQALRKKAIEELARRRGEFKPVLPITLSAEQERFINDPAKRKIARAGRRSGKSTALAVYFVQTALNIPNAKILYLALTREMAREIMWGPIVKLLTEAGIKHTVYKSELKIIFSNGSFIRLFGCDADAAKNRLLGQSFHLVAVDECGYTGNVDDLVMRVIMPALTDYDGTLCLTSTPPSVFKGLFYEADEGKQKAYWSHHSWDLRCNPAFKKKAETIFDDIVKTQFGGNPNHPTYRREYLGHWVAESEDRIYPIDTINLLDAIPPAPTNRESWTVLGLDLGLRDPNAITVLRVQEDIRTVYELETWSQAGITVDQLAAVLETFINKYQPKSIQADTGGYGSGIVNELKKRYSFAITAAEKKDKSFYQEIVKADMLSGYCKFLKDSQTVQEMQSLIRDIKTGQEDTRCANHLCDAFLYAYKYVYNRHLKYFEKPKTEEEQMIESVTRSNTIKDKTGNWWE